MKYRDNRPKLSNIPRLRVSYGIRFYLNGEFVDGQIWSKADGGRNNYWVIYEGKVIKVKRIYAQGKNKSRAV